MSEYGAIADEDVDYIDAPEGPLRLLECQRCGALVHSSIDGRNQTLHDAWHKTFGSVRIKPILSECPSCLSTEPRVRGEVSPGLVCTDRFHG